MTDKKGKTQNVQFKDLVVKKPAAKPAAKPVNPKPVAPKPVVKKAKKNWLQHNWGWVVLLAVIIIFVASNWEKINGVVKTEQPVATQPTAQPAATAVPPVVLKAEDIQVKAFADLGQFLLDGDPLIKNWKIRASEMTYTCTEGHGVFISMDPGVVQGQNTGELGAVAYVNCPVGSTVKLLTIHWSKSALHNQVHLVELTDSLSTQKLIDALKVFKVDEGKELALFIDGEKVTKY